MANDGWTKRTLDLYAGFLRDASDITDARQLLLDFFTLATTPSEANDFTDALFRTQSITLQEYAYNQSGFVNKLSKELDLKK